MAGAISARPGDVRRVRPAGGAVLRHAPWPWAFARASRPAGRAQFDAEHRTWVGVPPVAEGADRHRRARSGQNDPNAQMIVRADELQYDNTNNRIIAVGNVQIYYKRSTLEADRVVYEQTTKRMRAEGNARFTEADGKIVTARSSI